jgi:ADP-heptose:LPS heptosyltransferase
MLTDFPQRAVIVADFLRCLGMWLAATLLPGPTPRPTRGARKKLLAIRLDAIGDFVLWLDGAKGLRRLYPADQYEITLLGNDAWTSLALDTPYFDRVWPLNRKRYLLNPVYFLKMLGKVRREGFDLALSPAFSREFKFCDIIAKASRAPVRIGSRSDGERIRNWQKRVGNGFYTRLVPASGEPLMELERNAEFLRELGASEFRSSLPELRVSQPLPAGFAARDYFVIFPGASSALKRWPPGHFRELSGRIQAATGWTGIVCGGSGERSLGDQVAQGPRLQAENWAGRTSLGELASIIAGARLVVTNDTSAVHIAAALATPVVCVLGGGHFGRFLPYQVESRGDGPLPVAVFSALDCYGCSWARCSHAAPDTTARCISSVSVQDVWEATSALLKS